MRDRKASLAMPYGLAALSVAVATGLQLALDPVLGDRFPFVSFLLAILLTARVGGFGPALAAVVLGALSSAYFLLPPRGALAVHGWEERAGLGLYLILGLGMAVLGVAMRADRRRAARRTEAVAAEREKLRITLASIGDAVVVTDALGRVESLNGVAQALTGWAQEEAQGRPLADVFVIRNETTGQPVEDPVARVLKEGRVVGLANHTVLTARDGTRRPIDDSAAPIRDERGHLGGAILVFRDVSEQRRAERALRESEERHRLIADLTADYAATCRVDDDGGLVLESVTDGFSKVTGYTLEGLESRGGWTALIHPDDLDTFRRSVGLWLGSRPDAIEIRIVTGVGEVRWLNYLGRAVDDPERGRARRLIIAAQDVTDRRRQQSAIAERERLAVFGRDVAFALNRADTMPDMLQHCAEVMVSHLHGAFARIWTLDEAEDVLELRASAGLYTHLDGPHSRVPVGRYKIGLIAQERAPHLTNDVIGDPRVGDQAWAQREGMVAFAGYPLLVEDRLVGVMAMFARQPLSGATLEAMASVAIGVASGIERKRAQDRLGEQREWLRVTLASIGDAVITTDTQGRVTFLNAVARDLTGWSEDQARGLPLESVFAIRHEETRQPVENPVARVLREGRAVGLANHTALLSRDGTERPIDDSAAPIRTADGTTLGVVLVFRDVTEHRRAERELRQSEARKGAILETALDCIITCDQDGAIREFNPAAERTFGYARAEVLGRDMVELIIPPALREPHRRGMAHYLATGEGPVLGRRLELPALRADGTEFPVEVAINRIAVDGPPQFTAYLRDISDRTRLEARRNARLAVTQVLAEAETVPEAAVGVLRAICENLGWDLGFFWTREDRADALRCLESWRQPEMPATELEAASRTRVLRKGEGLPGHVWAIGGPHSVIDVVHDANFPRAVLGAGEGLRGALACPIVLGRETLGVIEFFSREAREPDADLLELMNTVAGQIGQFLERKQAEDRLRRNERELADFFENASEGLHWIGPDGTILRANRAELELLGYAAEEYVGHPIAEFHVDAGAIADILRRLRAGEELLNYEARLRCKDGSIKHVLINSNVMRQDGRFHHSRCFTRDVTERKRGEAVLAGQKRVLELLVQGAPLPDVLDALCEVIEGQSREKLIATILLVDEDGRRLRSVAGRRAPSDYAKAVDGVPIGPRVGSCGTAAYRGEPVIVSEIAADPLWSDFRDLALGHGLRACWSTPIFSSRGNVLGTFAVYYPTPHLPSPDESRLVDILTRTAGVAIERRKAEESLEEAGRRKDEFLATLAHELRNPLAPMRNALQVIQLASDDAASVAQAREMMERQMRHMVRLVDDLLDVSRITRGKMELRKQRVDLATVVRTAVEASRPLIEAAGHEFTAGLPPRPIFVDGDPVRLSQVLSNLLNNAAKYTERGGRIWLTVERHGSDAVISVRDTGLGIPPEMLGKVFELFTQVDRTLEKAQGGLGIGLTLVRRLVEMHGGSVEVRSEGYGRGSEFTVRLPAVLVAPARDEAAAEEGTRPARRRILVVDDNRDSAISLGLMLKLMGNEVRTAHDGLEAVQAAEVFRPDVALLDIGLPKLNGYEAARRIREQAWGRDLVLIAVTGWGQEDDKRRSKEAGFNFHMVKPVEPAALEKLLAGLLAPA